MNLRRWSRLDAWRREKNTDQEGTEVQTLVLSKDVFPTRERASEWVREHDFDVSFRDKPADETEDSWRYRQRDVGYFVEGSLRTIDLAEGVKAVVGRPRG